MAGHAAGDRMDGVFDLDAGGLQLVGHLAQRMLGLGHRHAVAGDDDHLRGVLEDEGGVFGRALLDRAHHAVVAGRRGGLAAEAAEDDRDEGAVHPLAHDVGEDRAGRADQRAGDDQRGIAEREADAGRRPARIGIQHRDHHRHVGAADRDDDQDAERQRDEGDKPEGEMALGAGEDDDQHDQQNGEAGVHRHGASAA